MDRKSILFCYEARPTNIGLAGGDSDYKRIQEALEARHEVIGVSDLATARLYSERRELVGYYDFAVLNVERGRGREVTFVRGMLQTDEMIPEKQVAYELVPFIQSLQVLRDIRRAQPGMQVILYRNHNTRVVQACVDRELIDFYTRAEGNGVHTLDDEIKYIQKCIAGEIVRGFRNSGAQE